MPKKTVAWIVSDEYEGNGTVVFHKYGIAARRIGAEEIGGEFEGVECRRAPDLDQYAETGVSFGTLIKEHGWWGECWHCYARIHEDEEGIDLDQIVCIGDAIYCNDGCRQARQAKIDRINDEYEQFQVAILSLFPSFEITGFDGEWPCLTPRTYFTFPGAEYGGWMSIDRNEKEIAHYVANGDLEAFNKWQGREKINANKS